MTSPDTLTATIAGLELLPCPFCGGVADDTHAGGPPELHDDSHTNIYVWCPSCGAKGLVVVGGHGGTREEAIAAWNRRPLEALTNRGADKEAAASMGVREEQIMRAIAQADERNGAPPYDQRVTMGKHAIETLRDEAREVLNLLAPASPPTSKAEPVRVRELVWSQSRVFGAMKRRGSGLFGEFTAFIVDDMTPEEIAKREAEAQEHYSNAIRSALEPAPTDRVRELEDALRKIVDMRDASQVIGNEVYHNAQSVRLHRQMQDIARSALQQPDEGTTR